MSQKVKIYKNTNRKSTAYNKYFAKAVYDNHFVETEQLAEYIQNRRIGGTVPMSIFSTENFEIRKNVIIFAAYKCSPEPSP